MPRANIPLTNFELTNALLRAIPTSWVNSYDLTHPMVAVNHKALREELEIIEKSENSKRKLEEKKESSRDKKKKAFTASPKVGNPNKDSRNPNGKHCSNCAKHGGPHKTHDTAECFKWNSDGSRKSKPTDKKWVRKVGSDCPKANYAQLQKQIVSLEKKVKKAGKNKRKGSRKECRQRYSSSDSEDSSDSE